MLLFFFRVSYEICQCRINVPICFSVLDKVFTSPPFAYATDELV
jgi:hypothetical protein